MKTVSFSEFRKNASALLDLVERGETLHVQRHGKTVAKVVPAQTEREPAWKRPRERITINGGSLSRAILDERRSSK